MSGIRRVVASAYGQINKEMQTLLLAADKAFKSRDKIGILGHPKWPAAHAKFEESFTAFLSALANHGHAEPTLVSTTEAAEKMLNLYKLAYPNWPAAYGYCEGHLHLIKAQVAEEDAIEAKRIAHVRHNAEQARKAKDLRANWSEGIIAKPSI